MGSLRRTCHLCLVSLLLWVPLAASRASAAAAKSAPTMKGWEPHDPDPTCDGLQRSLMKHVTTLFGLKQSLDKAAQEPPQNLKSMFKSWSGQQQVSQNQQRLTRLMDREREMSAELNRMAASVNCAQIDVDAELRRLEAEQPAKGPTVEDVPVGDPLLQQYSNQR